MAQRLLPFLRYLLIIGFVTISFLFSPKPHSSDEYCGKFYDLGEHAGFVINCDSYEYVRVSVSPRALFEEKSIRQSRPLFIIIGSAISYTLYPLLRLFHFNVYEAHFAGFLLLNLLFILLSLYLMDRILIRNTALITIERSAFLVLLISNIVTKMFFWTAHQQMFTFLTPLLCIYLLQWLSENRKASILTIASVAFACGLSLLLYGNFLLLAICFVSGLLFYRSGAKAILTSLPLIVLPTVIWLVILKCKGLSYYNHEVEHYHQFVWVGESLRISLSAFATAANGNWRTFIHSFGEIGLIILALSLLAVYYTFASAVRATSHPAVRICFYLIALSLLFLYLMGFYQERLTYILVAPLLVLIAVYYNASFGARSKWQSIMLCALVLIWHLYQVTRYGPFS